MMIYPLLLLGGGLFLVRRYCGNNPNAGPCRYVPKVLLPKVARPTPFLSDADRAAKAAELARQRELRNAGDAARRERDAIDAIRRGSGTARDKARRAGDARRREDAATAIRRELEEKAARARSRQARARATATITVAELDKAARIAKAVVIEVKAKGRRARISVAAFQRAVKNLSVDGQYGPNTAGAVRFFAPDAPPPVYHTRRGFAKWTPPRISDKPSRTPAPRTGKRTLAQLDEAARTAVHVEKDLKKKPRRRYDGSLMRVFQSMAGLAVDSKYGPSTAGALQYFLGRKPPPSQYGRGIRVYKPTV